MTEVTNELMYEVLKSIQARLAQVDGKVDELKMEVQGMRGQMIGMQQTMIGMQQETAGVHATLVRHEPRLDRIGERLELNDAPSL
jgi:hypothetical protein